MRYAALVLAAVLCSIALVAFGQTAPAAAHPLGLFTIVEGEVSVIRESRRFPAVDGMELLAGDIVRTAGETALARIELGDGGAMDLGPDTAVQLAPRYAEGGAERAGLVYLMQGWLKLGGQRLAAGSVRGDLMDLHGAAVLHAVEAKLQVFLESGGARLMERFDGRPAQAHAMAEGDTFLRRGADAGLVTHRSVPQFLQAMPKPFTDALPLRAASWHGRSPAAPAGEEIAYADVAAWINAERALRPGFVARWRGKAREPQWWRPLLAELPEHPEWHRVMYPEKYTPASLAAAAVARQPRRVPPPAQSAHAGASLPAPAAAERAGSEAVAGLRPAAQ